MVRWPSMTSPPRALSVSRIGKLRFATPTAICYKSYGKKEAPVGKRAAFVNIEGDDLVFLTHRVTSDFAKR